MARLRHRSHFVAGPHVSRSRTRVTRDDLTKDELRTLLSLVHTAIDASRFPMSERVRKLKEVRRKLRRSLGEPEDGPE